MGHSQYTANPLNPPYQGDFEDFAPVEIIGKCTFISRAYYSYSCPLWHHEPATFNRRLLPVLRVLPVLLWLQPLLLHCYPSPSW